MSGKAMAMKSLKEKWLSIVQSARGKGVRTMGQLGEQVDCSVGGGY